MARIGKKIGFLGAGNMARAIAGGIVRAELFSCDDVLASDISPAQREEFTRQTGCKSVESNLEILEFADVIVFAIKPFHVAQVCAEIRKLVQPEQLFVSICAGIRTAFYENSLGASTRVIRVMPNTPALIGCGATAIARGNRATSDDLNTVRAIFDAVGVTVVLEEDLLDLVTGLSGSGPAYVFYFAESLIRAATTLGLSAQDARTLVLHTLYGAARMAIESNKSLEELRQAVTTKGGTTEAGLRQLAEGGFSDMLFRCVDAATRRSRELSGDR